MWATGQSGGAPDMHCSLFGAPSNACSDSARVGAHCSVSLFLCRRPLALFSRYSAGTPDIPVNYSAMTPRIPEAASWRESTLGHRTLSGAPDQGSLRLSFALFIRTLFYTFYWFLSWTFYWFVLNLWHL
jgi:hypothetical protein